MHWMENCGSLLWNALSTNLDRPEWSVHMTKAYTTVGRLIHKRSLDSLARYPSACLSAISVCMSAYLYVCLPVCLFHSFIHCRHSYSASSSEGYSEALPTPARPNNVVLSCWKNFWENTIGSDRRFICLLYISVRPGRAAIKVPKFPIKDNNNYSLITITFYMFIHSFIADIYIAPLQVGLLRSAPNPSAAE